MFCQHCGAKIEKGIQRCPKCKKIVTAIESQGKAKPIGKSLSKKRKDKKIRWLLGISIIALIIVGAVAFWKRDFLENTSEVKEMISAIQNGYLGHYNTVTIKEVLENAYDGEWNGGEAKNREGYIIEYAGNEEGDMKIQFSINGLQENTFKVSGIGYTGISPSLNWDAYDVKCAMDALYEAYAIEHPEKGLCIDYSIDNNTLEGHTSSIRPENEPSRQTDLAKNSIANSAVTNGNRMGFRLERIKDKYYSDENTESNYEFYFYIENDEILFSIYQHGIDIIRQAKASVLDDNTLHFEGYDDWNINLVWNSETSFSVTGTGEEITNMIGKQFIDSTPEL